VPGNIILGRWCDCSLPSIIFAVYYDDMNKTCLTLIAAVLFNMPFFAQPAPLGPLPTAGQLAWHRLEQYAFVHFSMNTFTGKEWGFGDESTELFNPVNFDARQWVKTFADAGLNAVILTCKHHDGFCLWPSRFTTHSVSASPFRDGKGDVVREVAEACQAFGLKFGIYLSPWDRNHPDYGTAAYLDYYRNQLTELLTTYGPVFEMWFDGANGGNGYYGGSRELRKINPAEYYEWPQTLDLARSLQPGILFFSDAGPDIRWCGNESGFVNETNWCLFSNDTLYPGKPGIENLLATGMADGDKWIPAEVDVSIRPGWFYHENENERVKTAEQLFRIYLNSVGRGANLLLNIPPGPDGLLHPLDIEALTSWKQMRDSIFARNIAAEAQISATHTRPGSGLYGAVNLTDGNPHTYWATDDTVKSADIILHWDNPRQISYVLIQEHIELGQRIRQFEIDALAGGEWKCVVKGTTIGYKRIAETGISGCSAIRIRFIDAKACPVISNIEVY